MKRFSYFIFLMTSLLFASCSDFLETEPESQYTASLSYKTPADFTYAIAGVYNVMQDIYRPNRGYIWFINNRSDEMRNGGSYLDGIDQFNETASNSMLETFYRQYWQLINRSNKLLSTIEQITFSDESLKLNIKGEAYGLRGWAYFMLGWQFGGMPLIDKEMTVRETKSVARTSQDETLNFAAADLQLAAKLLPEVWTGSNTGRMTKYAAEGLLAKLYLFKSKYAEAIPILRDIIHSGKYDMEHEYINCFTDSHNNGKERVFEVQFSGGLTGQGDEFPTGCLPQGYTDKVLIPFAGYNTACRINLEMVNSYETGDLRKDVSTVSNIIVNGVLENQHAFIRKFIHYDKYEPQDQHDWANNLPIIRYTDALMMYAECLNELDYQSSGEAFNILNRVRRRAGLPARTSLDLPDKNSFRQALRQERKVEFAFEGWRWFDLVRWGIARETINHKFAAKDEGSGRYFMASEDQLLFPIPYTEISRYNNTNVMWQNPGY